MTRPYRSIYSKFFSRFLLVRIGPDGCQRGGVRGGVGVLLQQSGQLLRGEVCHLHHLGHLHLFCFCDPTFQQLDTVVYQRTRPIIARPAILRSTKVPFWTHPRSNQDLKAAVSLAAVLLLFKERMRWKRFALVRRAIMGRVHI